MVVMGKRVVKRWRLYSVNFLPSCFRNRLKLKLFWARKSNGCPIRRLSHGSPGSSLESVCTAYFFASAMHVHVLLDNGALLRLRWYKTVEFNMVCMGMHRFQCSHNLHSLTAPLELPLVVSLVRKILAEGILRGAGVRSSNYIKKAYNYFGYLIEHLLVFTVIMARKGKGLSNDNWSSSKQEEGERTWAGVIQDASKQP